MLFRHTRYSLVYTLLEWQSSLFSRLLKVKISQNLHQISGFRRMDSDSVIKVLKKQKAFMVKIWEWTLRQVPDGARPRDAAF